MSVSRTLRIAIAISIAHAACDSGAKVATQQATSKPAPGSPPAIEPHLVSSCVARYGCGMSHPGLGSYENARSVDLATCTRTVTFDEAPDNAPLAPPGSAAPGTHTSKTDALPADRCAEIAKLLAAITAADAAAAQEAAQVDTQACILDVMCPQGGPSKLRIQRQTTSGGSRVERLLQALSGS